MLPRLQRRGHSLNVAEVVGPKGVVVTSAERGPRLDHFRHATRIRHRKTLTPTNRGIRFVSAALVTFYPVNPDPS